MTGSRVFGGASENSDVDIVIIDKNFFKIFDRKRVTFLFGETPYLDQEHYLEAPDNFQSVKALYCDLTVNIIVVTDQLFLDGWLYATQFMIFLGKTHPLNLDRGMRRLFFELIKISYVRAMQYLKDPKGPFNRSPRILDILFKRR